MAIICVNNKNLIFPLHTKFISYFCREFGCFGNEYDGIKEFSVQFEIILDKHVEGNWIPRISCLKIYT
jgi:hypothetical protein